MAKNISPNWSIAFGGENIIHFDYELDGNISKVFTTDANFLFNENNLQDYVNFVGVSERDTFPSDGKWQSLIGGLTAQYYDYSYMHRTADAGQRGLAIVDPDANPQVPTFYYYKQQRANTTAYDGLRGGGQRPRYGAGRCRGKHGALRGAHVASVAVARMPPHLYGPVDRERDGPVRGNRGGGWRRGLGSGCAHAVSITPRSA